MRSPATRVITIMSPSRFVTASLSVPMTVGPPLSGMSVSTLQTVSPFDGVRSASRRPPAWTTRPSGESARPPPIPGSGSSFMGSISTDQIRLPSRTSNADTMPFGATV